MTIILRPLINEKSMVLTKTNLYTFEVAKRATKDQIAYEVADKFKVKVLSVKTLNKTGKIRMQKTRKGYFKMPDYKKAIVKVSKGDKIAIFEHSEPTEDVTVTTGEGEPVTQTKEKKSLLRGTKIKIEKTSDKGLKAQMEDHQSPTKQSQKPKKKGKA